MAVLGRPRKPREVVIDFKAPHQEQDRVLREAKRFNVINAGRRWGKNELGLQLITIGALGDDKGSYPVAWYSPTYKMLTETWRATQEVLGDARRGGMIARTSEQEHRLELLGGGVIEFWSLDDPEASRGRRYKRVVIDEAAKVPNLLDTWQMVIRPMLADFQGDAYFMSTPKGLNDFHELWVRGQEPEGDWKSWSFPTWTNPFIPPDELKALKNELGPTAYAQEIGADFTVSGDAAFPEFDEAIHVIPTDYELIERWKRVAGHDWGYASPAAHLWFARDPKGGVVAYREFSCRKLQPDEIAQEILWRQGDERVLTKADPALWRIQGKAFLSTDQLDALADQGKDIGTTAWQYAQAGLTMLPANNARIQGKLRLHSLLGLRPEDGVPWLRFMNCCPDAIKTFQNLQIDPDRTEDVLTDYEPDAVIWRRDEFYDCARYATIDTPLRETVLPRKRPQWLF